MNTGLRRGRLRGMRALRPAAGAVMAAALAGQAGGADVESVYDPDVHTTGPGFNIALSVGTGDTLTIEPSGTLSRHSENSISRIPLYLSDATIS